MVIGRCKDRIYTGPCAQGKSFLPREQISWLWGTSWTLRTQPDDWHVTDYFASNSASRWSATQWKRVKLVKPCPRCLQGKLVKWAWTKRLSNVTSNSSATLFVREKQKLQRELPTYNSSNFQRHRQWTACIVRSPPIRPVETTKRKPTCMVPDNLQIKVKTYHDGLCYTGHFLILLSHWSHLLMV